MIVVGDLGVFDPEWRGWIIRRGQLVSPEGWEIRVSDVLASRLHLAQIAIYQGENRRLKAELAVAELHGFEEQPTPDQWEVEILTG